MAALNVRFPFSNGHVQTLFPPLFRPCPTVVYQRQRVELSDGDFVDIDWSRGGSERVVLLLHGLEGHSRRKYVLGMVRAARLNGFDAAALNFRGCSGTPNRKLRMYHSGWTSDLHEVLLGLQEAGQYRSVDIVGFSLGANVLLKYLGEDPGRVPDVVEKAVALSVPCDLADAATALERPLCAIYVRYLLDHLRMKIIEKDRLFPGCLDLRGLGAIRTFLEFDDRFTAPLHGFRDAREYWARSSSRQFLSRIEIPCCIINARNDPFLGPGCFPDGEVKDNPWLRLLTPKTGGHVGFVSESGVLYWSEWTTMSFLREGREPLFKKRKVNKDAPGC